MLVLVWFIRNHTGSFYGAAALKVLARDAEQAECLAFLFGAQWCLELDLNNITLEGDCRNVVNAITSQFCFVKWENSGIEKDCKYLLLQTQKFQGCRYVNRKANRVADLLARYACKTFNIGSDDMVQWIHTPPSLLFDVLNSDTMYVQSCSQ
ncbi:hypothetical protein BVC80_1745g15 [Macleaya cordata]|uniref:RNase H type-1 domain-containing protein n=1 Tax=Macleaya cordata TaxID=56857 RepID=A0A200QKQ5_MACCD|nr:hypothetical protein BVC80_1745g15 [Macleaya cordata]